MNSPIVKGYLLKEDFRRSRVYRRTDRPEAHFRQMACWRGSPSGVTTGAFEGMNDKVKIIDNRSRSCPLFS